MRAPLARYTAEIFEHWKLHGISRRRRNTPRHSRSALRFPHSAKHASDQLDPLGDVSFVATEIAMVGRQRRHLWSLTHARIEWVRVVENQRLKIQLGFPSKAFRTVIAEYDRGKRKAVKFCDAEGCEEGKVVMLRAAMANSIWFAIAAAGVLQLPKPEIENVHKRSWN